MKFSCLPLIIIEIPHSLINSSYMFILFTQFLWVYLSVFQKWARNCIENSLLHSPNVIPIIGADSSRVEWEFSEPVCYWNQWKPSSRRNWHRGWKLLLRAHQFEGEKAKCECVRWGDYDTHSEYVSHKTTLNNFPENVSHLFFNYLFMFTPSSCVSFDIVSFLIPTNKSLLFYDR